MKVRAKMMVFDGMKRVRPGQICEVDDSLIEKDENGNIIKPRWAEDISKPPTPPATTPYPKKLPEVSQSVIRASQPVVEKKRLGRPPKQLSSASVI